MRLQPAATHEKNDIRPYTSAMSKKTAPADVQPSAADISPVADFETSLDALEALVERMELGQLSLEDSLAAYERSVGLYRRCQQALEQAELRVRLLSDPDRPESAQAFGSDD
jgi:exodeoxyribonuclease VII small subunit